MDLILSLKKNENLSSKIKKLISLKKLKRVNLKEDELKLEGLKAINTTGNMLFPEIRRLIEDRFNK